MSITLIGRRYEPPGRRFPRDVRRVEVESVDASVRISSTRFSPTFLTAAACILVVRRADLASFLWEMGFFIDSEGKNSGKTAEFKRTRRELLKFLQHSG